MERPGTLQREPRDAPRLHCNSACASRVKPCRAKQGEMGIPTVQAAQEAVAGGLPRALEPIETSSEGKKEREREGKKREKCELGEAGAAASARSLSLGCAHHESSESQQCLPVRGLPCCKAATPDCFLRGSLSLAPKTSCGSCQQLQPKDSCTKGS